MFSWDFFVQIKSLRDFEFVKKNPFLLKLFGSFWTRIGRPPTIEISLHKKYLLANKFWSKNTFIVPKNQPSFNISISKIISF